MIEKVKDIIQKRVTEIDKDEVIKTMEMLNDRIKKWRDSPPIIYGSFSPSDNIPLMYPAGSNPPDNIKLRAWSTPSTMRNVDSTCDAIVINEYINIDNLEA
jgi:hypothetical protein